ncbi:MAG: type II toxin-antitoxin system HicB family antitoxin [Chloroflexi bacterium]|nr:type II toxin-antitoxin system HicB family antitoxin [Chloroflexota bacterium]
MLKYETTRYWSEEDRSSSPKYPNFQTRMAHGDSHEAFLVNVKDAIQLWIDTAQEFGDPIPEPKGRRLMLA